MRVDIFVGILIMIVASSHARLVSGKSQESGMIRIAAGIGERWHASALGEMVRDSDSAKIKITAIRKQVDTYEDGIFSDMNIGGDIAAMLMCAKENDVRCILAIDAFDSAASRLCPEDQIRYFCAKARVHEWFIKSEVPRDSLLRWIDQLATDYTRAVAQGFEVRKAIDLVRRQLEGAGLKNLFLDEYACRMYQASLPWSIGRVKARHTAHKGKEAVDLAIQIVQDIPFIVSVRPGECGGLDSNTLATARDQYLVRPLIAALGTASEGFVLRFCTEFWSEKRVILLMLPRVSKPSKEAFELMRRAAQDDVLGKSSVIAIAEVALWRKSGKLKQFKSLYPQRYLLAVPHKMPKKK